MSSLAQAVSEAGIADRIFSERQLAHILGGGTARRYGLVNRALKDGSLIRVKRGTYLLGRAYRSEPAHPFAVAQSLVPGSYVSFETALAYHGWIPEAAFATASATPGRKTLRFETDGFGLFTFHPLAIEDYRFLVSVDRVQMGGLIAFVAQPLRALMDLVAWRKEPWSGLDWVVNGLRVDEEQLASLTRRDFRKLKPVYKHKGAKHFLDALQEAVLATGMLSSATSA